MLAELPTGCDVGSKRNNKGYKQSWTGYKLHIDVADGQIPVACLLTSASVHDSQVAIPMMTFTGQRINYLYDLSLPRRRPGDAAYDAAQIAEHSRALGHIPVIDFLTLERAGLIRRQPGVARSIEVLVDPDDLPALRADSELPVKSSVQRY
jgi:hypothetical protein